MVVSEPSAARTTARAPVALSEAVVPGHPCGTPLPHPAAPVQHQPQPRRAAPCAACRRGVPAGLQRGASRPTSPVPRLSPQGTPEALPYPILRRLSSTSESGAAPRSAWLGAALAGRPQRAGRAGVSTARGGRRRGRWGAPGGVPRGRKKGFGIPIRKWTKTISRARWKRVLHQ
jgi:hypothetical protein